MQDVNDLRRRLIDVWNGVKLSVIDDTIAQTSSVDVTMPAFEPE